MTLIVSVRNYDQASLSNINPLTQHSTIHKIQTYTLWTSPMGLYVTLNCDIFIFQEYPKVIQQFHQTFIHIIHRGDIQHKQMLVGPIKSNY